MIAKKTLRFGSRGPLVEELQQDLNAILHAEPLLKQDGIFGPKTHQRVKAVQSQNGLVADGVVGHATWDFITGAIAGAKALAAAAGITELNPVRYAIARVAWNEWMMHGGLVHARYKGAKDPIQNRYYRQGWQYLTDYFSTAAPNYELLYGKDVTKYMPHGGQQDRLPAWCGIFAVAMLKRAMQPVGTWKSDGKGMSGVFGIVRTETPRKGDLAYRRYWHGLDVQHHAIVYDVVGTGSKATIVTIDGNSGAGSSITKNEASRPAWDSFYKVTSIIDV